MENNKRSYLSTGETPYKPERKRGKNCCLARKSLPFSRGSPTKKTEYSKSPVKYHYWNYEEERALVEFTSIARTDPSYNWCTDEVEWPSFRQDNKFWEDAARHIRESTGTNFLLTKERRRNKPYAIPVKYIPYNSIRDQFIRDMSNEIKTTMVSMEMNPVGCVSDGEFSSLRTQGETRPLHIWQLLHDAKESVRRQSEATLLSMLVKIGEDDDGLPLVERNDRYVPSTLIQELHDLRFEQNLSLEDSITYLRGKLVPDGYSAYPFRTNTPESQLDKLRSLVATYRFRGVVKEYKAKGIDFSLYLYVPETDPITGEVFHEREDHCHLLKRIWKHTREGGPPGF